MNKRASTYVLLLVMAGVFLNHISLQSKENGLLLVVDEREIDIIGWAQESWVSLHRSCQNVVYLDTDSAEHVRIQRLIQAYSPPGSASAHIASLTSTHAWALAEVEFKELLPAVVLIHHLNGEPSIVSHAIWSGYTQPWRAAPYIRSYISAKVPQVPAELLNCFEPRSKAFAS